VLTWSQCQVIPESQDSSPFPIPIHSGKWMHLPLQTKTFGYKTDFSLGPR
jgi:hypothetical protein